MFDIGNSNSLHMRNPGVTRQSAGFFTADIYQTSVGLPVDNAVVKIFEHNPDPAVLERQIDELRTDSGGQTVTIELPAPDPELSLDPQQQQTPYSEYDIEIIAPDLETVAVKGVQVLPGITSLQEVTMLPVENFEAPEEIFTINPHTLWGDYPPKVIEEEVKPLPEPTGYVVLDQVVVPQYVIVHDGAPTNNAAPNHWIPFKDYIKNVASCEIYSTWPVNTIRANILAIISFTLNRVFTEWYRNQGKNFTITTSTAFDQAFSYGRNIFKEISEIVDEIFVNYITKNGILQPLFTQYCDGIRATCPNALSQWGSKYLGDQGYSTINILKNYYGNDIYLDTAPKVSGVPSSYPGSPLRRGSSGNNVRKIQQQLNTVANNYPAIPKNNLDGQFGEQTENAVRVFQKTFRLPVDGVVGQGTWYKLSEVYTAVAKLS